MRVFAYCCASFAQATRETTGVEPITCPPTTAKTVVLPPGPDFVYFDLHGEPGEACWRGDDGIIALTAEQVTSWEITGAVVFAVNCYLADQDSPMMEALLAAGARYVVGGQGQNYGPRGGRLYGAPLLGKRLRQLLERGVEPLTALALAKRWLSLYLVAHRVIGRKSLAEANEDALAFRAYVKRGEV